MGMGREALSRSPAAVSLFERASRILGYDLAQLCLEGPAERLDRTDYSQPALFVTSLAMLEALRADSPEAMAHAVAAAGLSLGEYTALVYAGALDFEEALQVVQTRGQAMQQAAERNAGGMVSVLGPTADEVEGLCQQARLPDQVLEVANYLCPGNTVVSGSQPSCERLVELVQSQGSAKVVPLAVAGAFHTRLMEAAVEPLTQALAKVSLRPPRLPIISNVDASPQTDPERIRSLLVRQVVQPVRWENSIRYMLGQGIDTFYEVGPGRVLRGLLKRIDRSAQCHGTS